MTKCYLDTKLSSSNVHEGAKENYGFRSHPRSNHHHIGSKHLLNGEAKYTRVNSSGGVRKRAERQEEATIARLWRNFHPRIPVPGIGEGGRKRFVGVQRSLGVTVGEFLIGERGRIGGVSVSGLGQIQTR